MEMEMEMEMEVELQSGGRLRHTGASPSEGAFAGGMPPAFESKSVKLFGVKLTDYQNLGALDDDHNLGMMRKSVSMGNLGLMGFKSMQTFSSESAHARYIENAALPPRRPESGGLVGNITETGQQGYASDGLMQTSSMSSRERRKGVPWTEEEHRLFLAGLQKLGKGDWRGISRNFVTTRTPTQVASHAQKYFLRQCNLNKRKRRSSLFDIINSNTVTARNRADEHPQSVNAVAELNQPIWELGMRRLMAPSSPLLNPLSPLAKPLVSTTIPNVSADLCLGRLLCSQRQPQQYIALADDVCRRKQASEMDVLSLGNYNARTELDKPVITVSSSSSSRSSPSSPTSSSSLCRIDEASELSSLSLSIGPPMSMDRSSHELALKLEPPIISRQAAIFSSSTKVCERRKDVLLTAGA